MARRPHAHGIPPDPIQKETADKDKSKQAEPKEAQSPEVANKAQEGKRKNQAKDNGNEKEEKQAETKSAGNDNAEKSPDERSDASNGAPRRSKLPQGSKLHSHRFAHPFTNLHRFLLRIHLTPQTAAIIFHSRLNRKA